MLFFPNLSICFHDFQAETQDSQTAMFKYKGKIEHIELYWSYLHGTAIPQQMCSLHGQPAPASYLHTHKGLCCNNSCHPVPPVFDTKDIIYCLIYFSGLRIYGEPSSDAQAKPSASSTKSIPTSLLQFLFPLHAAGPHNTDAPTTGTLTWVYPALPLPPLSHCTCLILSWQFFG